MTPQETQIALRQLNCCVIVPTYNNAKTLARVLHSVLDYTKDLIVVCDGATDNTPQILEGFHSQITLINYSPNKGKGYALRKGFKTAVEMGFDYAITLDSDGQHYAKDIPNFIQKQKEVPGSLIIGARNMNQESVPSKSSFGNKFSNFWFKFETGIEMPDTQSGFRMYPVKELSKTRFFTRKFEFEIEVIVKGAWRGIPIVSAPIQVLYDPEERVSHFRPFRDFTRISILNTYLVTLAIFYHRPRIWLMGLKKKGFKEFVTQDILKSKDSVEKKTLSVMLGLFIGCSPLWGYQTASVIGLALLLRLNRTIAFIASNISLPPIIPFIILGSIKVGEWITGEKVSFDFSNGISWDMFANHIEVYVIGAMLFGASVSLLGGAITYITLLRLKAAKT